MYTFVELYARPRRISGRWSKVSVSGDSTLLDIPGRWGQVVIIVAYSDGQVEKSISFDALRALPEFTKVKANTTISEFLSLLGNKTLPFDDRRFTIAPKYARYANLTHQGFTIQPIARHDNMLATPSYGNVDLSIKAEYKNGKHIGQYGAFSVNGFFHLSDYDSQGVYIHGGNKTVRRSNDCQVGFIDFSRIGKVRHFPITEKMITKGGGAYLKDMMYITLPDTAPVEGWSYIFFIGGYMIPVGEAITQVGVKTYRVGVNHLNLIERYYDSKDFLNMDCLDLTKYPDYSNEGYMSIDEFFSDDVLKRYFTLPQSFIIAVETPHLFHDNEPIDTPEPTTGVMDVSMFDNQPLMGVNGRQVEYSPVQRDDTITLHCSPNIGYNYTYVHRPWNKQKAIDSKQDIDHARYTGQMCIRLLGCDT